MLNAVPKVERIESIFSSPDFYSKFATQAAELNKQLEVEKQKVKSLYERWEELKKIKSLL